MDLDAVWARAQEDGKREASLLFPDSDEYEEARQRIARQIADERFQEMASRYPARRKPRRFK